MEQIKINPREVLKNNIYSNKGDWNMRFDFLTDTNGNIHLNDSNITWTFKLHTAENTGVIMDGNHARYRNVLYTIWKQLRSLYSIARHKE